MKKQKTKHKLTLKNNTGIFNSFKIILAISVSDRKIKKQCVKESSRVNTLSLVNGAYSVSHSSTLLSTAAT